MGFKANIVLFIMMLCFLSFGEARPKSHHRKRSRQICREPSDTKEMRAKLNPGDYKLPHETFLLPEQSREWVSGRSLESVPNDYIKIKTFTVDRQLPTCSMKRPTKAEAPLCPYHFEIQYDFNRIPSTMMQARCSCISCVESSPTADKECKPVYYYTRVLRRVGCEEKEDTLFYKYDVVWEPIQVGCQCVYSVVPEPPPPSGRVSMPDYANKAMSGK